MILRIVLMLFISLNYSSCGKNDSSSDPPSQVENEAPEQRTDPLKYVELNTEQGNTIRTSIAYKSDDQQQGLSGVRPENFDKDQGKLFFYFSEATRTFWMPDTYFALDIFYLDENLNIERIVRDLPFYQGNNNEDIPRAPAIRSRHVLEMRADSEIADSMKEGDQLEWESSVNLDNIEDMMRENL